MPVKIESNIKRVRKSVKDEQGRYILRSRALARRIGREVRENVRALISPKPAGVFPGYAMTGALQRKVAASEPQRIANGWVVTVRVLLTGKTKLYALIHEIGGVIKAKNKPYLVFWVMGQWVRVKQVKITAKHYFRDGVERTRRAWNLIRLRREF